MFKRIVVLFFVVMLMFTGLTVADALPKINATQMSLEKTEEITTENNETRRIETEVTEATETTEYVEETEAIEEPRRIFSEDITFTGEYVSGNSVMPYAFYAPTNVTEDEEIPLIVWLHGAGEVNVCKEVFMVRGFPSIIENWQTEGFNAYIICPHLFATGSYRWDSEISKNNLKSLLEYVISKYNIDVDNIMLAGHSLGGQGAIYMAKELDYFKKCIVLSGYCPSTGMGETQTIMMGYTGRLAFGEDPVSINFMEKDFANKYNSYFLDASHGELPGKAFALDAENNNRSDLIEWFFEET